MQKTRGHDLLAAFLRAAREKAGMSQRELASRLGTNQTAVSFMENGDQAVRVAELLELADILGFDPKDALDAMRS